MCTWSGILTLAVVGDTTLILRFFVHDQQKMYTSIQKFMAQFFFFSFNFYFIYLYLLIL